MAKFIHDVKKNGFESFCVFAPCDQALDEIKALLARTISAEEAVRQRRLCGANSYIFQNGFYVKECFVYVPHEGRIFISRYPLVIQNAEEATECHRNGKEFYITPRQVELATRSDICVEVPNERTIQIPTADFAKRDIICFLFGKEAEDYARFMDSKEVKVDKLPIWTVNPRMWEEEGKIGNLPVWTKEQCDKPFARQMWLYGFSNGGMSGIGGNDRCLHYGNAVRAAPGTDIEFDAWR